MDKEQKIEHLLSRNVEDVIERDHLRAALESGKKLRVKLGIDPTSPDLHLGHAVVLSKLREFQELGHVAVLIIGDFTAQIGDPSGRDKTRPPLTEDDVKENMKKYLKQAGKILDIKKLEITYNSSWLGKLRGHEILELLGMISLQQLTEREDFAKRIADHKPLRMHELLYPVMQGYDSVAVKADVELGGTDQLFNLLVGRDLMEKHDMLPQDVLTVPLLVGTDGDRKMSKSLGNYIGLDDEPADMFGKVMSVPDTLIGDYFLLGTELGDEEIAEAITKLSPRDAKVKLAFEIVRRYYGAAAAKKAQENFEKVFSRREVPDEMPPLEVSVFSNVKTSEAIALEIVVASGIMKSRGEARRLIEGGGFEFDGKTIKNPLEEVTIHGGEVVRVGKKSFFRMK